MVASIVELMRLGARSVSVSTIIGRAVNSIAVKKRQPVAFLAAFVVALRSQVPKAIHTVGDLVERRFAEFAGVPTRVRLVNNNGNSSGKWRQNASSCG